MVPELPVEVVDTAAVYTAAAPVVEAAGTAESEAVLAQVFPAGYIPVGFDLAAYVLFNHKGVVLPKFDAKLS